MNLQFNHFSLFSRASDPSEELFREFSIIFPSSHDTTVVERAPKFSLFVIGGVVSGAEHSKKKETHENEYDFTSWSQIGKQINKLSRFKVWFKWKILYKYWLDNIENEVILIRYWRSQISPEK